jgi:hypothetical protein
MIGQWRREHLLFAIAPSPVVDANDQKVSTERYPLEWLVVLIDEQAEGPMLSRTPHDRNEYDV